MNTDSSKVLLKVKRGSLIERNHSGFIVVVDENEKIVLKTGNFSEKDFYIRSCAKPFQAMMVFDSGAYQKFNLTLEDIAICCASHYGTDRHVAQVKSVLDKIGLSEGHLKCGIHAPFDTNARHELIRKNISFSPFHNNCSGKHAGMLTACLSNNWDIEGYLDENHPLQKKIFEITNELCNLEKIPPLTFDGCGTPISGMPLHKMGMGFLNLLKTKEGQIIKEAFINNPFLIGNYGNIDTDLMKVSKGKLLSKIGAEGLCVVVNTHLNQALVVKILDQDKKARSIVVIESLKQLGWLSDEEINSTEIKNLFDLDIKTVHNQMVGEIQPVFKL